MEHAFRTGRAAVVAVIGLAALTGACGSSPSGEGLASLEPDSSIRGRTGREVELDAEEAALALTECLRDEGFDFPDPEFDDQGNFRLKSLMDLGEIAETFDPDDLREGFEACEQHLEGVAQLVASIDRTDIEDRLLAYAACMREQGYDLPDPVFDVAAPTEIPGSGEAPVSQSGPFGEIDQDDPRFREANEVCVGVFGETLGPGGFGPPVESSGD